MKWAALALLAVAFRPDDEELKPVDADLAHAIADRLTQEAASLEKPPLKLETDASKAVGLHIPERMGLLVAPQKDLKEGDGGDAAAATGKPVGYLFLYRMVPTIEGKAVEIAKMPSVEIKNDEGKTFTISTVYLSVRRVADNDWHLYGFGKDREKPLLDVKLSGGTGPGDTPIAVQVKEVGGKKDTLVVTLYDKYQAAIPLARLKE